MMLISFLWTLPTIIAASKFLASDNACFNAVDRNQSTIFNAPKKGTLLGIELIYKSGSVTCGYGAYDPCHFGCAWDFKDYPLMIFLERVTNSDSYTGDKYYPTTDTDDVTEIVSLGDYWYWYHMESYTINSHIVALLNPTYTVSTSQQFMLQYGEADGPSNGDNQGTACAQVYFVYKDDPVCISGSGAFDAKYEMVATGDDSYARYAVSIDKYLYYKTELITTICVGDENTGSTSDADECCSWGSIQQYPYLDLEGCEWGTSDPSSSSSTYCQDFCISDDYHSVLDGTYVWHHYNVTTHSSVYYYASAPSYLFLWFFEDEDVWEWRIGSDYTDAGAWSACFIERDMGYAVEGQYPDTCEGWKTYYDDAWNTDDIGVEACGYYVAATTTTTEEPTVRNIYGYGDDSDEDGDDLTSMWIGLGIFGGLMFFAVIFALSKNANKTERNVATKVNGVGSGGTAATDTTTAGGYTINQGVSTRGTGSIDTNNIAPGGGTRSYPTLAPRTQFTTQYNVAPPPSYDERYNNLQRVEVQMVQNEGNNTVYPRNNYVGKEPIDNGYNINYHHDPFNNEAPAEMIGNQVPNEPLASEYNNGLDDHYEPQFNDNYQPEPQLNDNYEAEPQLNDNYEAEPQMNDDYGEDGVNNDYNDFEGDPGANNNDYAPSAPEAAPYEYNADPIEFDGGVHIVLQGHDMEPVPEYVAEPEPVAEPIPQPVAEPFVMEPMAMPDPSGFAMEVAGSAVCMI